MTFVALGSTIKLCKYIESNNYLYVVDFYLLHLEAQFLHGGKSPAKEWGHLLQGSLYCKKIKKAVVTINVSRLIILPTVIKLPNISLNILCYITGSKIIIILRKI
jgi:hypothetical protein